MGISQNSHWYIFWYLRQVFFYGRAHERMLIQNDNCIGFLVVFWGAGELPGARKIDVNLTWYLKVWS